MCRKLKIFSGKNGFGILLYMSAIFCLICFFPGHGSAKMYLDINAPSIQKFRIAVPDFKTLTKDKPHQQLALKLTKVIENDLKLSGYFSLIDKRAFLAGQDSPLAPGEINFKDWSVIGAELLLVCNYTCIGKSLTLESRMYNVFSGRQILGKRVLGDKKSYRHLIHRLANEIIIKLTGHPGVSLTKLAFISSDSGHKEVFTCDYDGHRMRPVTRNKNIALLPRFSHDGKKLVYTSYKEGGNMLYLIDLVSGKEKRLSGRSGINSGVSWEPGDTRLVLTMSRKGNPDICMINLNGKILKRLTTYWGIDVSPTFSPDGKRLAFVSNRSGTPQIYVLDLTSERVERLTFSGKYNTSPSWSYLNKIAFVSLINGSLDVYSMDPNGDRLRKLTENSGKNEDPCWSPDGRYIVFSSNRKGTYNLYIMSSNGQNQRRITSSVGAHSSPTWAP